MFHKYLMALVLQIIHNVLFPSIFNKKGNFYHLSLSLDF